MKLLLDTHLLLWAASDSKHLSKKAKKLLNDNENQLFFSVASIWEIIIKNQLGRNDFSINATAFRRSLIDNSYIELPILGKHTLTLAQLADIHKDPFDRILLAQSISEGLTLLSADKKLIKYGAYVQEV